MFDFVTLDNTALGDAKSRMSKHKVSRSEEELTRMLRLLLKDFKDKKPKYIVDISPSNFNGYGRYPLSKYKMIYDYVKNNYRLRVTISKMNIWQRQL